MTTPREQRDERWAEEYLRARRNDTYGELGAALLMHYGLVEKWFGERVWLRNQITQLKERLADVEAAADTRIAQVEAAADTRIAHVEADTAARIAQVEADKAARIAAKDAALTEGLRRLERLDAVLTAETLDPAQLGEPETIPVLHPVPTPHRRSA